LGSVLAWNYGVLLACCLLTGVGAALVPPNGIVMLAEVFPPEGRGQAIGWFVSASGVGVVLGVPLVAGLLGAGGWRLPIALVGAAVLGIWLRLWVWCPRCPLLPDQALAFFTHCREVGAHGMVWYLLAANALQQMALLGVFSYLAIHLLGSSVGGTDAGAGWVLPAGLLLSGGGDHPAAVSQLKVRESDECLAQRVPREDQTIPSSKARMVGGISFLLAMMKRLCHHQSV
jgi:predicted MFS family arabinose efflux permease